MGGFPNPASGTVTITPVPLVAANVLDGAQSFAASGGPTTVITVPAGKTWIGNILVSCACDNTGAAASLAEARGTVTVAGAGAVPPAGTLLEIECLAGANVVAGLVGTQTANSGSMRAAIIAPAGNAVTVQATAVITGTSGRVAVSAIGELQ